MALLIIIGLLIYAAKNITLTDNDYGYKI